MPATSTPNSELRGTMVIDRAINTDSDRDRDREIVSLNKSHSYLSACVVPVNSGCLKIRTALGLKLSIYERSHFIARGVVKQKKKQSKRREETFTRSTSQNL